MATKLTLDVLGKRNALNRATRFPVRRSISRLEKISGSVAHLKYDDVDGQAKNSLGL